MGSIVYFVLFELRFLELQRHLRIIALLDDRLKLFVIMITIQYQSLIFNSVHSCCLFIECFNQKYFLFLFLYILSNYLNLEDQCVCFTEVAFSQCITLRIVYSIISLTQGPFNKYVTLKNNFFDPPCVTLCNDKSILPHPHPLLYITISVRNVEL